MKKLTIKMKLLYTVERIYVLLTAMSKTGEFEAKPLMVDADAHVTAVWIMDFLGIHKSSFYRNVHKKLIEPAFYVGRRPYYLRADLEKLPRKHGNGAHTFGKLSAYKKKKKT